MSTLTPSIIALVATSVVCQVFGASLMPLTKGLTEVVPTKGRGIAFAADLRIMTRSINSGINLSELLPFMAAVVPPCAITDGVTVYIGICPKDLNSVPFVSDTRFCEQHVLKNN